MSPEECKKKWSGLRDTRRQIKKKRKLRRGQEADLQNRFDGLIMSSYPSWITVGSEEKLLNEYIVHGVFADSKIVSYRIY